MKKQKGVKAKKMCAWLIAFMLIIDFCTALTINEIMYNPVSDDNNKEFVEIFFDSPDDNHNLSDFIITDLDTADPLVQVQYVDSEYALIVEEGFDYTYINASVYSVGATIGNNLNNGYDTITLKDPDENILATASYDGSLANNNCKSIEFFEGEWFESADCDGTPGRENSATTIIKNLSEQNQTENTNTTEPIIREACIFSFFLSTDKQVYEDGEQVKLNLNLKTDHNFTIEYWIEDLNKNIIKKKTNTSNTNQKSWTPHITEQDKSFYAKAVAQTIGCTDENNTIASEQLFTVKGKELSPESTITIEEVYTGTDDAVTFGEILRVRATIYKGDTSKSTIDVWIQKEGGVDDDKEDIEKISEISKLLVYDKFREYEFTIPLQIKPNCDNVYDDGKYILVLEGLDLHSLREITVEGNKKTLCSSDSASLSSAPSTLSGKVYYSLSDFDEQKNIGEEIFSTVLIENDGEAHDFEIWSYVYRGSKSYSGEREQNKKTIHLGAGEKETIDMKNIVDDAEPGTYRFKVKIRKDDQVTINELIREINLTDMQNKPADKNSDNTSNSSGISSELAAAMQISVTKMGENGKNDASSKNNAITGKAVQDMIYQSPSSKAKDLIIYFILAVFALLLGLTYQEMKRSRIDKKNMIKNKETNKMINKKETEDTSREKQDTPQDTRQDTRQEKNKGYYWIKKGKEKRQNKIEIIRKEHENNSKNPF